jgi:hypothetical protein
VLGTPEATGFDDSAESCPKRPSPIPEILANIDTSTPSSQIIAAFFSGPVPLPAILRAYNDIVPGSAEKIIANTIRAVHDECYSIGCDDRCIVNEPMRMESPSGLRALVFWASEYASHHVFTIVNIQS